MKRIASGMALVLLVATASLGQEPQFRDRPRAREASKMVDAYLISNMQESLELSDEQFAKLIPLVKRSQQLRRELAGSRAATLRELRRELGSGSASEAEVERLVSTLDRLVGEQSEKVLGGYAAIDAELDPIQRGKYRVMEAEVEQRIRELMRRAAGGQGERRRP